VVFLSYHKLPLAISIQATVVLQEQVKNTRSTNITTNQTVFYAVVKGSLCKDEGYAINIIPLPLVDAPGNVLICT
jgi:hypothetical protein